ncbi:hypothetical protein [Prescottella defluvii]|uniref:hypothetical protein n=1 Tax=Prescottella defluvii TaxID=1323361 RepID=UPI000AAAD43A|nr:hypothetical protein [Prescottella defluvii]
MGAACIAVAAVGLAGIVSGGGDGAAPAVPDAVHLVADARESTSALPCDAVERLDRETEERVAAGLEVPGAELWPPVYDRVKEPRPAVAPLDPTTGIPKNLLEKPLPPEAWEQIRAAEAEAARAPKVPRPCGVEVDEIQAQAEATNSMVACYLPDGRYTSTTIVDMVPIDPSTAPERPTREVADQVCRSWGYDRSEP